MQYLNLLSPFVFGNHLAFLLKQIIYKTVTGIVKKSERRANVGFGLFMGFVDNDQQASLILL